MRKFLLGVVFLFFILIFPKPASALWVGGQPGINQHAGYTFDIYAYNEEPNPPEYIKDTSNIRIDIYGHAPDGSDQVFPPGDYAIKFVRTSDNYFCRGGARPQDLGQFTGLVNSHNNPGKLSFLIEPKGVTCNLEPSTYKISIWSTGFDNKIWFEGVDFPINSPTGGGRSRLAPVGTENPPLICSDRVTEVGIENAEEGKTFNLWWDGDKTNFAWQGPARGRSFTVPLTGGDGNLKPGGKAKLCMVEGDRMLPPGGMLFGDNCASNPSLDFSFDDSKCAASSGQISCTAEPYVIENNTVKKGARLKGSGFPATREVRVDIVSKESGQATPVYNIPVSGGGTLNKDTDPTAPIPPGKYTVNFYHQDDAVLLCTAPNDLEITETKDTGNPPPKAPSIDFKPIACSGDKCAISSGEYCDGGKTQLRTVIGCVPVDPGQFIAGLMRYITGFSGGIALLLMVFGAFQMMTSAGNAENLKKGREQFVSAVIGLLFIIFSVLLMQIIGVDLLGLPGFSK